MRIERGVFLDNFVFYLCFFGVFFLFFDDNFSSFFINCICCCGGVSSWYCGDDGVICYMEVRDVVYG